MKYFITTIAVLCLWLKVKGVETLTFDASPTPNVTYRLAWGTNATGTIGYLQLGTNLVISLTNGPWGAYYFQVTAFSTNNVESAPSNVLLATNRPAAPLQLRIQPGTNIVYLDGSINGTWQRIGMVVKDPMVIAARSNQMFRLVQYPPLPPQ